MTLRIKLLVASTVAVVVAATALFQQEDSNDNLVLNQIQVLGSHNSYKRPLHPKAKILLQNFDPNRAFMLDYSHQSLTAQLDIGLRHLELDVLLDPEGGRFSVPFIQSLDDDAVYSEQELRDLSKPGLKVMHVPDVDVATHCILFQQCLTELKSWSERNPQHLPIFVLLNVKERGSQADIKAASSVLKFSHSDYKAIDKEIRSVLQNKLLTPDLVRGGHATLQKAITESGWPNLDHVKGKFVFVFDGNVSQRELYRKDHPSLTGRAMFASYKEGEDEAAIMIVNDPIRQFSYIQSLVEMGYVIRTRADGGNHDGRTENRKRVNAAFSSGAQIISTDFYPSSPQADKTGFVIMFDGVDPLKRCNLLNTDTFCTLD